MSKQDRQGVRTPADLEQKYNFGKSFEEVMGLARSAEASAKDAQTAAALARSEILRLSDSITLAVEEVNGKAAEAQQAAETAQTVADKAAADLAAAEKNLEDVQNRQDATDEEIAQAKEDVETAKKNASDAQTAANAAKNAADEAKEQADTARSEIKLLKDSITLSVVDGEPGHTAQIKLKVGENEYSGTIDLTGMVTFTNLSTAGETVINGSNITTGQILADLIKAGVLRSKDGQSVVIDLDNGVGTFRGSFTTTEAISANSNYLYDHTTMNPEGIKAISRTPSSGTATGSVESESIKTETEAGHTEITPPNSDWKHDMGGFEHANYGVGLISLRTFRAREVGTGGEEDGVEVSQHMSNLADGTDLAICLIGGRVFIRGLTAPVNAADATNKAYVDGLVSAINAALTGKLAIADGIQMLGDINSKDNLPTNQSCLFRTTSSNWDGALPATYSVYARLRSSRDGNYTTWLGGNGADLYYTMTSDGNMPTAEGWKRIAFANEVVKPADMAAALAQKAPAGFGYGETMTYLIESENLDARLNEILSTMADQMSKQIQIYDQSFSTVAYICTLWRFTGDYAVVDAVSYGGYRAVKCKWGGVWYPWTWENPPLFPGQEYRTTQMWNGKTVCTMVIDCGHIMAGDEGNIALPSGITEVVRFNATARMSPGGNSYRIAPDGFAVRPSNGYLDIAVDDQGDIYDLKVQLWYTKD